MLKSSTFGLVPSFPPSTKWVLQKNIFEIIYYNLEMDHGSNLAQENT